jgi:hypothetical protein
MCISDSQILAFDFACHQIPLAPALGGDTRGPANKLCCHVGYILWCSALKGSKQCAMRTLLVKINRDQIFCKNKDGFEVPLGTKPDARIPSARLSTKSVELVRLRPNDPSAAVEPGVGQNFCAHCTLLNLSK